MPCEIRGAPVLRSAWEVDPLAAFTNQARLTYAGGAVSSNRVSGEITEVLTLAHACVSGTYEPGGRLAWAVSIRNAGDADITDLTVTADLGAVTYGAETLYPLSWRQGSLLCLVDGAVTPLPVGKAGPPLTITGVEVPAGGSTVLVYETDVTEAAPLGDGAQIVNTVSLTGSCVAAPLTAAATAEMDDAPILSIVKALEPAVITGCGQVTYTFTLENAGGAAGEEAAIVVSDVFTPTLAGLTATLDGQVLTADDYAYDEAAGVFATTAGRITVPAATYRQEEDGTWTVVPGVATLTVTGVI